MPRKPTSEHDFSDHPLGGRIPEDRTHVEKFPLRSIDIPRGPRPSSVLYGTGIRYDQGQEGACVGMCMGGITSWNLKHTYNVSRKVDAFAIYHEAQKLDEYPGEDYEGTSTRAGFEVLRTEGAPYDFENSTVGHKHGIFQIAEYRWATSVDDLLDTLCFVGPLGCGLNWYDNFDRPQKHAFNNAKRTSFFIGEGNLGSIRGGHDIMMHGYYRNRDGKEWVRFQNSWGWSYPLVWMPVDTLRKLWDGGEFEAGVVTRVLSV